MFKLSASIVILAGMCIVVFLSYNQKEIPSVKQEQFMTIPNDLRDYPYCEIIPIWMKPTSLSLKIEIYTTTGLNKCPISDWQAIDDKAIVKEYGLAKVMMNGPRFWTINSVTASEEMKNGKIVKFGDIEMRQVATVDKQFWELFTYGPYQDISVRRNNTFFFNAGNRVYEMKNPMGEEYIMQSYSQIVDKKLKIDDLEQLGDRLSLPAGWSWTTKILTEEYALKVDGLATVTRDDLFNTYQKKA